MWLSGTNIGNESNFYWFGLGDQATYPNGIHFESHGSNQCIRFREIDDWFITSCTEDYYFFCEY